MVYNVYSVRDEKQGFAAPFLDVSNDSAMRGFEFAFKNQNNIMSFSPSDFSLYKIGTFDSDSGALTPELPSWICCASVFTFGGNANAQS